MSEKDKSASKNAADNSQFQVWKNPTIIKAISGILSEIINENARESVPTKAKGS